MAKPCPNCQELHGEILNHLCFASIYPKKNLKKISKILESVFPLVTTATERGPQRLLDTVGFHLVTFKITFKVLFQWDKNCRILIIITVIAFSSSDFELLTVVEAVQCFCSSEKAFKNLLGLWETMGSPL